MKNIRKVVALGLTITTCFYNVPAIYADNSDGFIQNLFNSPDVPSAPPSQDIPAQADEIAPQNLESPHNSFFGVSPLSLPETKSGQVPIEEAAPELIGQVPGLNPIYEEEGLIGGVNVADLVLVRRNFTPREVIQVNAIVKSDLINSFGFSEPMLKDLIEKGLLKIEVDLKNRAAKVLFDPSVVLGDQPGLAYLFDLLGSHKLPSEIRYQLGQGPAILAACTPDGCPPSPPYFLISGSFQVDGQRLELFELNYMPFQVLKDGAKIKGQLYSVRVFDGPSSIGLEIGEPILIKEINYKYDDENKTIHAQIVYPNGFSVASRDVEITKMEDGQYHIQSVVDRDSSGNVIATSKFKYSVLLPGISPLPSPEGRIPPVAYVSLWMISRTDAEGGPLSEVRNISADQATVVLPDGKEVPVTFNPLEELFEKTFKVETLSRIFVEAFSLIGQLGAGGTITIADAERMRQVQARLKSAIEVLPRDQQTEWVIKFNEYLNRGDQILATKTLKVVLADGREII
ncbi:MAG: hypothetical protein HYZ85_05900, partial [Candidatus Omnitrophica bacterium]|nr:hypothetical protein [Candidatus Omnitrophota bacterium]